jgi:DNA-binding protein HU-beta
MNKKDLVRKVAVVTKLSHSAVQSVIDATMETIGTAMESKDVLMLVRFGTFTVAKRKARTINHPATGKRIRVEAKTVPVFRPGTALKKRVAAKRGRGRPRKR